MALGLAPERHQSEQDLPTEVEPVGIISRIDNQNIRPVGRISLRMPNMSNANSDNDPIQRRLRQVEESLRRAHSILDQPRQAAAAHARVAVARAAAAGAHSEVEVVRMARDTAQAAL